MLLKYFREMDISDIRSMRKQRERIDALDRTIKDPKAPESTKARAKERKGILVRKKAMKTLGISKDFIGGKTLKRKD
jgi:hypothetical protein